MPVRGPRKPKPLGVPRGASLASVIRAVGKGAASAPSRATPRPSSGRRPPAAPSYEEDRAAAQGTEVHGRSGDWWSKFFDTPRDFTKPQGGGGGGSDDRRKTSRRASDPEVGGGGFGGGADSGEDEEAPAPWHFPDVEPTATSDPERPRTEAAGYDAANEHLYVRFRAGADKQQPNGAIYRYSVPPAIADIYLNSLKTPSPGQFINHVLNHLPYERTTLPE